MDKVFEGGHKYSGREEESVLALNGVHGTGIKIKVDEVENMQLGGFAPKSFVYGRFVDSEGNESGEKIPMLVRAARVNEQMFGGERDDMPIAQRFYERWKFLRDIGVSTIPNVVALDDERVAMVNMVAHGGGFFGKEKITKVFDEIDCNARRKLTTDELAFLDVNLDLLAIDIKKQQQILFDHNVRMPFDDPMEIFVSSTGGWEVVIWDITHLKHCVGESINVLDGERSSLITSYEIMQSNLRIIGEIV